MATARAARVLFQLFLLSVCVLPHVFSCVTDVVCVGAVCPGIADEYKFPTPPLDLQEQLKAVKLGEVSDQLRTKIVRWLHLDICRYTLYPGKRNLYYEAARLLVYFYPTLRDINGPGFNSWWRQLKNRTKNQRKSLSDIAMVKAAREKYGKRKRADDAGTTPASPRSCIRQTLQGCASEQVEDDATLAAHKLFMVREMHKQPDHRHCERITDAMRRTYSARRSLIEQRDCQQQEVLSVAGVLTEYPALALEHEIYREFHRLTNCQVDSRMEWFVEKYGGAIISAALRRKHPHKFLKDFPAHVGTADDRECTAGAVWTVLPALLKEAPGGIIYGEPLPCDPAHPSIEVRGALWAPSSIKVRLEDFSMEVVSLNTAMALVLSLYWVYNIQYCQRSKKVFTMLEHSLGLPQTAGAAVLVTKLQNEIGFEPYQ
ncbi:uncharacterized protein LOC135385339 isoform X2 [Ornithodoros turicata]|uniref:uncharacterized protein LOC135366475 isoform X2 n=1 Tax=Ornithodoros turicata TaxID=34597 RepID=UPI00313A34B3